MDSAARTVAADPRASIAERYQDKDRYIGLVAKASLDLLDRGFLLAEDLAPIVRHAARHWDYLWSGQPTSSGRER